MNFRIRGRPFTFRALKNGFAPTEFISMFEGETNKTRFSDILGSDGARAMRVLTWRSLKQPMAMGVFDAQDMLVAIGFATPITIPAGPMPKRSNCALQDPQLGVNLSYAVSSKCEGRGLGQLVSCLAISAADSRWPKLRLKLPCPVNIQTKLENLPSIALAGKLGLKHFSEADFSITRVDGTKVPYISFRGPWVTAVDTAHAHLSSMGIEEEVLQERFAAPTNLSNPFDEPEPFTGPSP